LNSVKLLEFFEARKTRGEPLVLVTVFETAGSTYSKAGAQMLVDQNGVFRGMLSGGCLEGDLAVRAQQVIESAQSQIVTYDLGHDTDELWGMGVGCDGLMRMVLQPLLPKDDYEPFARIAEILRGDQRQEVTLNVGADNVADLVIEVSPPPQILVLGAGLDAEPVVRFAAELGWRCTVVDHRPAYIENGDFAQAVATHCLPVAEVAENLDQHQGPAARAGGAGNWWQGTCADRAVYRRGNTAAINRRLAEPGLLAWEEYADDQVAEFGNLLVGVEIDIARLPELEFKGDQTACTDPDHIEQHCRTALWRNADSLQASKSLVHFVEHWPQVSLDEPGHALTFTIGFLQDNAVQGRLITRKFQVSADKRLGLCLGFDVGDFGHCLDDRNIEFAENAVGSRSPQLVLVLEMVSDQWVVDPCTICNIASGCPLETVLGKRLDSRIKQLLLRDNASLLLFSFRFSGFRGSLDVQEWLPHRGPCTDKTIWNL
jgi:xanthine/CO dehydrogenase XdhC/CoxF family maturation factor